MGKHIVKTTIRRKTMMRIERLSVEDYATTPIELTVVSCMKGYLRSMSEQEALQKLSKIIKPKIIRLNGESGVPLPVQSVVEGAKLAAFIDDAVADSIERMESREDDMSQVVAAVLKNIDGKHFVETMSVEVIQFIADAYRALKYLE